MANLDEIRRALIWEELPKERLHSGSSAPHEITVKFAGTSKPSSVFIDIDNLKSLTSKEKAIVREVLASVETYINVDFKVVGSGDADLDILQGRRDQSFTGLTAYPQFGSSPPDGFSSFIAINSEVERDASEFRHLFQHELGHALGLEHPFDGDRTLPGKFDNQKHTVMSYDLNPDHGSRDDSFQLYDVAALQRIWGANEDTGKGNDVYTGPRNEMIDVIWDTGGTDRFDAAGYSDDVLLDLREGRFSSFAIKNDVVIAFGTRIERAEGGDGDDKLVGNGGGNKLAGRDGDDVLRGKYGADTLRGGEGDDRIKGQEGDDDVKGQNGSDRIEGNDGDDRLDGGNSGDWIRGGDGDDHLTGGGGADDLAGGSGDDRIEGGDRRDRIDGGKGADHILGGDGSDRIDGDGGRDKIKGQNGNDVLDGGGGADLLRGGGGSDRIKGNGGDDVIAGNSGWDTLSGGSGDDTIKGNSGKDVISGGRHDDKLTGGAQADRFIYRLGDDRDAITDFENNVDVLDLRGFDYEDPADALGDARFRDGDVVFRFGGDDRLIVLNMTLGAIENDIVLA